jgi:hypothetical protein
MRLAALAFFASAATLSQAGVIFLGTFEGHGYYITDADKDIQGTRNEVATVFEAVHIRPHLAAINSEAEDNWLREQLAGVTPVSRPFWWIGLSDEAEEGVWHWDSGETPGYFAWGSNQPGPEDWVYYGTNMMWQTAPYEGPGGLGAQGVIEVVPEPATMAALALGGLALLRRRRS